MSVARGVLREENQDNLHESNSNENIKGNLKLSYSSKVTYRLSYLHEESGGTSKSKGPSNKLSLILLERWVKKKDGTNRRNIVLDTNNFKSSEKKETDCLSHTLFMIFLLLVRWLIWQGGDYHFTNVISNITENFS